MDSPKRGSNVRAGKPVMLGRCNPIEMMRGDFRILHMHGECRMIREALKRDCWTHALMTDRDDKSWPRWLKRLT